VRTFKTILVISVLFSLVGVAMADIVSVGGELIKAGSWIHSANWVRWTLNGDKKNLADVQCNAAAGCTASVQFVSALQKDHTYQLKMQIIPLNGNGLPDNLMIGTRSLGVVAPGQNLMSFTANDTDEGKTVLSFTQTTAGEWRANISMQEVVSSELVLLWQIISVFTGVMVGSAFVMGVRSLRG
jgi:hypothetical protein